MQVTQFTYEIAEKDDELKTMLLTYRTEGAPDVTVGVPYPRADLGQTMEFIAASYAPYNVWQDIGADFSEVPDVGFTGEIDLGAQ